MLFGYSVIKYYINFCYYSILSKRHSLLGGLVHYGRLQSDTNSYFNVRNTLYSILPTCRILGIFEFFHISGTVWARNVKFGMLIDTVTSDEKKYKIRSKGVGKGLTFKILWPLHISETVEARNIKFGTQIDRQGTNEKYAKLGHGSERVHETILWNFGPFRISGTVWVRNIKFGMQIEHQKH